MTITHYNILLNTILYNYNIKATNRIDFRMYNFTYYQPVKERAMDHLPPHKDDFREIWVNEFTETSAQKFREQVLTLASMGDQFVIPVYIDSYGGNAYALAKMLETMDSVPNRFLTSCSGKAMSCGAILLSHGDMRYCGDLSTILIHNMSSGCYGDLYEILSHAEDVKKCNESLIGLLAKNCGKSYAELQELLKHSSNGKDLILDAKEAFDFGIIDAIGSPMLTPILQFSTDCAPLKDRLTDADKGVVRKKTKKTQKPKKKSR